MTVVNPDIQDGPSYDAMAVRDSTDSYSLSSGASAATGVVLGMQVTQDTGSDMKVQVAPGSVLVNNESYTLTTAWTSGTITAANTGDRRDVVVYRAGTGPVYITGTPTTLTTATWTRTANQNPPVKPNIVPATDVVLAEVYVAGTGGTPTTAIVGTVAGINGAVTTTNGSTGGQITGNIVDKTNVITKTLVPQYTAEGQDTVGQGGAAGSGSIFTGVGFSTTITAASNGLTPTQLTTAYAVSTGSGTTSVTLTMTNGITYVAGQYVTIAGLTGTWASANGTYVLTAGASNSLTYTPGSAVSGAFAGSSPTAQYCLTLAAVGGPGSPNFYAYGTQYLVTNGNTTYGYTSITSAGAVVGLSLVTGSSTAATGNPVALAPLVIPDIGAGASIIRGDGAGTGGQASGLGTTDWFTLLSNAENSTAGLPQQGTGFVLPVYSDSVYGGLQWATNSGSGVATVVTGSPSVYPAVGAPAVSISGNVSTANPAVITSTAHGLVTGQQVTISGVLGATALNGTWTITVTGANTFTVPASGAGYTSGGSYNMPAQLLPSSILHTSASVVVGDTKSFRRVIIFFQKQTNGDNVTFATTGVVRSSGAISTAGSGVACWDSGDLGSQSAGTGFTATWSSGGGAGNVYIGALYIQSAGYNGVVNINVAKGSTCTGDWSGASTGLTNFLTFLNTMGMTPRRLLTGDQIGNDSLKLTTSTGANTTASGYPITSTGSQNNLQTFLTAISNASPLTQLVLIGIYNVGTSTVTGVGNAAWANTWIPAIRQASIVNNATFVDLYALLGDCSQSADPYGYTWSDYLHFGNQPFQTPYTWPPTAQGPDFVSVSGRTGQETLAEAFYLKLQTSRNFSLSGTFQDGVAADGKIANLLGQAPLTYGAAVTEWFKNATDANPVTVISSNGTIGPAGLYTGPGGSTSPDTWWYRSAAGVWTAHSSIIASGSVKAAELGLNATPPTVAGTRATVPPTQATIATALGSVALGTALQNTLSYDVRLVLYIPVTADTSGTILVGVGTTSTPTQVTVVAATTLTGIITVTATVPASQYVLVSKGGTSTVGTPVTYWEAA